MALRRAREQAGLSLEDVTRRTKVRRGILTAIEEDRHDELPALTYTLGFVKAYARTVGLDAGDAAQRYRAESAKADPVPSIVDLEPIDARQIPSRGLAAAGVALLLLALAGFWAWGAGLFDGPLPPPPAAPEAEVAQAAAPGEPDAGLAEDGTVAPAPAEGGPVLLKAREEVWLRIDNRETGARFFEGTLAPGQELAIPPGEPLQLRTGRAGAIEVRVGEAALPPLGGPVEQLRGVSLAPADLRARAAALPAAGGLGGAPRPGLAEALPSGG